MCDNKFIGPRKKNELLRKRIENIKEKIPNNIYELIISKYPQYNSLQGTSLINNVLMLKSSDKELTIIIEEIVNEHLQKQLNTL